MAKILIVEDDKALLSVVRDHLLAEHHTVESTDDGQMALDLLQTYPYDIAILDVTLPGISGIDVLKRYRLSGGAARVLILTGKNALEDKELGFSSGADDYLTKPFHVKELMARVRALMRRSTDVLGDELTIGNIVLSPRVFQATKAGVELRLTPKEFALLEFLVRHKSQVFKAEALLDRIWRSDTEASTDTVKSYIHRLRDKLGSSPETPKIVTVHGAGYKIEA